MTSLYRSLIFLLSTATIQVQAIKWDLEGIKGGYHQQQPELQRPTLQADSPSVRPRLVCPTCMTPEESKPYLLIQKNDEHRRFFEEEDMYFKSEYRSVRRLGQGSFGIVHLAIKKSSGLEVVYKAIKKKNVSLYTLESSPPPECHSTEIPALYGKHAGARCMSSRPHNLLLPFEVKVQEYLSKPGYVNPSVPVVIDYIVRENEYILVMEYSGEDWVSLDKYMTKHGKFSVDKARLIIKEVITALLSLKKLGVLHGDIAGQNILYNDKTGNVKLIDFGVSEPLEEGNQDSSGSGSSEDESYFWNIEKSDMNDIGKLMYYLLTSKDPFKDKTISRGGVAKKLRNSLDDPESQSAIDAVDLVAILLEKKSSKMTSLEDILDHSFFKRQ
ncbi:hypothetical protein BASA50_007150 [Batrachochytrium salamandrivorans]|uniref:non-specific serine/threonine protein kinase n=1 Tax=Batrachochytrium salamandrivorans TaxID=1357716 RepID=A0ABQ8F917_9FUNG|nr:hypothetical protein BASA50_007150 [Batrachochytrium salamandrivorans]